MAANFGGITAFEVAVQEVPRFEITGADSQIANIALQAGESLSLEPGAMMHMSEGVDGKMACADNCCGCKASIGGESQLKIVYTNNSAAPAYIGITPNFPAKIIPLEVAAGAKINSKMGGWMASLDDIGMTFDIDCDPKTACCGGMGCIRQALVSENGGTAFLAAGGTIVVKNLAEGEKILIDTNSIVAYDDTVDMDIRLAGNLCTVCCGGEGLFNTVMTGPGRVIMQSMSLSKMAKALVGPIPTGNEGGGSEGAPARRRY